MTEVKALLQVDILFFVFVEVVILTFNSNLESIWQSSVTSQDGLAEAIQLLSCRPSKTFQQLPAPIMQHAMGPPFIEEPGPSVKK